MKLTAEREKLLAPLQAVIGVVERRQTMPVLANVLLGVRQGQLSITACNGASNFSRSAVNFMGTPVSPILDLDS